MNDSTIRTKSISYPTGQASLVALGTLIEQQHILDPLRQTVVIDQKTIQHSPTDKLIDALIGMLAGAEGMVEVNTKVRSDVAVQRAFGRRGCAEQSTIQDTFDHCSAENVAQLEQVIDETFVTHSQAFWTDASQRLRLLDLDLTGLPCGKKAACATKGYFEGCYHRRGRQLGRVLASQFDEVVVDRIFAGNTHLSEVVSGLMLSAERRLGLEQDSDLERRAHTLVRMDAGGGALKCCNWLLERGYQLLTKDYSSQRASRLAKSVMHWIEDPRSPKRQVGWVLERCTEYVRPVLRLAVRCRTKANRWQTAVLITTLWPEQALSLVHLGAKEWEHPDAELLALMYLYDERGGAAETSFKGDKQGLGMRKRIKRHWEGQQMLTLLGSVAHNLVVWSRRWLAALEPSLAAYGIKRMVRDVFHLHGRVVLNGWGQLVKIVISASIPLAERVRCACLKLFGMHSLPIILGKT
jgi:hypothetical protein